MTVRDISQTDVVTAAPHTRIVAVAERMAEENVGSVVVVDEDRVAGILTDRQIALAVPGSSEVSELTATDLMTTDPATADPDDGVFDVVTRMDEEGVRRLPVTDDVGNLTGIVTLDDALALLASGLDRAADAVARRSPRF